MKRCPTVRRPGRQTAVGSRQGSGWPVGAPWGPIETLRARGDAVESRRVTTCSELRWKSHIFFWAETDMPQKLIYFWVSL